jgi:hypothetical protein
MRSASLLAYVSLAVLAATQAGVDVLWTDRFDRAGRDDQIHGVVLSGKRAFAVGRTETAGGEGDGLVRCHDGRSGRLCWQDFYDVSGGEDEAFAVAAQGNRVFVSGRSASASGDTDFLVRAYDARSGHPLWQDTFDPSGKDDRAEAVAARGDRVFVAGRVGDASSHELLVVRAYDGATGALLWQNTFDPPGDFVLVNDVAVAGRWVVVAGGAEAANGEDDFLVHVIDRASGTTVFDDLVAGASGGDDGASAVAVDGGRAFAVGWLDGSAAGVPGTRDLVVRAYDLAERALLWQDVFDATGGEDVANGAALSGGRLLVAGASADADASADLAVRCYAAASGRLLWQDRLDVAGDLDEARSVAAAGGLFFVGGIATDAAGARETIVRAYRRTDGALLLDDRFAGGLDVDYTVATAASGRRAVVAAAEVDLSQADPGEIADATMRGYTVR